MPSEKILNDKKQIVEEIKEKIKNAASVVLVDYKGINVSADTALRAEMRGAGVEYIVVKNSILRFVCEQLELNEFLPELKGTTAVAVSQSDSIAPSKLLQKYSDKLRDHFNIKIAYTDGKFMDPAQVKAIAGLPSREVLVAQVAGSLNGIVAALARAVDEVAKKQAA